MGVAEIDEAQQLFVIKANIFLYGHAADEELAKIVAEEITRCWTDAHARVRLNNRSYDFVLFAQGFYTSDLRPEDVFENDDPHNNYFRVEEYSASHISFVDGVGSNTGYFKRDNLLNQSTTAAHEFGHTLGLDHPANINLIGKGVPGIMYPRGTLTDPQYQYDPAVAPGTIGGTMNPFFRKVQQADVDLLNLYKLRFNEAGKALVGDFSSIWHEAHSQAV